MSSSVCACAYETRNCLSIQFVSQGQNVDMLSDFVWCLFFKCRLGTSASRVETAWLCLTCPTLESSISLDQMPGRQLIGCSRLTLTRSQVSRTGKKKKQSHTNVQTQADGRKDWQSEEGSFTICKERLNKMQAREGKLLLPQKLK